MPARSEWSSSLAANETSSETNPIMLATTLSPIMLGFGDTGGLINMNYQPGSNTDTSASTNSGEKCARSGSGDRSKAEMLSQVETGSGKLAGSIRTREPSAQESMNHPFSASKLDLTACVAKPACIGAAIIGETV